MGNIVFKPWVGSNYKTSQFGARILILGESHYGTKEEEKNKDFTTHVINLWVEEKKFPI